MNKEMKMAESFDPANVPEAVVVPKRRMRFSVVWIIPIVAAVVALGIAVQKIMNEGPTINIVFKEAEGIEADKTFVKYKNVEIGKVTKVHLSKDYRKVVVTAKIEKSAEGLIVEDAGFWIEKPRASLSGISGIGTLLSGNYIALEPGKSKKIRREFTGLEVPPAITIDQPGKRYFLQTNTLGSVGNGSPLYYRELNVGQVIGYDLEKDGGKISVEVFVRSPYDRYVTDQTRFWQVGGIDVSLGTEGVSVRTQSVLSMLVGGIAFETHPEAVNPAPAREKAVFTLFNSRKEAMANPEPIATPYVLYLNETLRGLNVGAPVTYLGLPVGEVTGVGLNYVEKTNSLRPRVNIIMYPSRFTKHINHRPELEEKSQSIQWRQAFVQKAIDQGLRAQLRSGSLLTGQVYVALDYFPHAAKVKIDWSKTPTELPTVPSGMQDLQNKLNDILAKADKIPFDQIGQDVKKLLVKLDGLTRHVDEETLPQIKSTLEGLKRVLESTDSNLVGKDAPAQQQLRDALQEITRAAQGINSLTESLEKNPEALIRGKKQEKP